MIQAQDILQKFAEFVSHKQGPTSNKASQICSQDHPKKGALIYLGKKDFIAKAIAAECSIVLLQEDLEPLWPKEESKACLLLCKDISLTMALINSEFFSVSFVGQKFEGYKIHPSAQISKTARLGKNCIIAPGVSIRDEVIIGDNVYIGPQTVIESRVNIKDNCYFSGHIFVGRDCVIGKNCRIQSFTSIGSEGYGYAVHPKGHYVHKPHMGKVVLEDDIDIGSHVSIDRGTYDDTFIGEGTKIGHHCHFAHNMSVGKYCIFVGDFLSVGSVTIGDRCVFFGNTSVSAHVKIVGNSIFGVHSGVSKEISEPGYYYGYPAQKKTDELRQQAAIKKLPALQKQIQKIIKKLNL